MKLDDIKKQITEILEGADRLSHEDLFYGDIRTERDPHDQNKLIISRKLKLQMRCVFEVSLDDPETGL